MPTLKEALLALVDAIDVKHGNKPAAKAAPAAKAKRKPAAPRVHRIGAGTLETDHIELYGTKGAHSESREPPKHDDVFPERFFTGNYTNTPRWYPYVIHKTMKATPKC